MSNQGTGSRWGSFLSQAVAGMEAHLDSMLAEGDGALSVNRPAENASVTSHLTQGKPGEQVLVSFLLVTRRLRPVQSLLEAIDFQHTYPRPTPTTPGQSCFDK